MKLTFSTATLSVVDAALLQEIVKAINRIINTPKIDFILLPPELLLSLNWWLYRKSLLPNYVVIGMFVQWYFLSSVDKWPWTAVQLLLNINTATHFLCYNSQLSNQLKTHKYTRMKLTDEEVRHIALLARLGISDAEVEKFRIQLSNILENFDILSQADTEGLAPTSQSVVLENVYRPDEAGPSLPVSDVLANAPDQEDNSFKVNAVLE